MSIGIDGISAMIDQTRSSAAYFVEQVMKEVEKTIPRNEENEDASMSQLRDFYKEEMIQTFAEGICKQQSLGLAQQMYEQMKRNYNL